ncbi:MAG TPA: KTSC domain-containing protein [Candidatus Saccharimonadales bacterium]
MNRISVSSSNISSIGYDAETQTLEVEFHDGSIYQYYGVPQLEHAGLMNADSHGKYLDLYIKDKYRYQKIK